MTSRCPTLSELPPAPPGRSGWPWTVETQPGADSRPRIRPRCRITIVTPSYNHGRFIEETIRSVILQGYPQLEYIVMDGGSQDGTLDVLRRYDAWIAHWVSRPDRGHSHAVNQGWRRATGDVVAWINSDDIYLPTALDRVMIEFESDPGLAVVAGENLFIDESGHEFHTKAAYPLEPERILLGPKPAQPSTFFRRGALFEVGLLDESLRFCMDKDLLLRLGDRYWPAGVRCIPVPLSAERKWTGAKTVRGGRRAVRERLNVIERFLKTSRTVTDPDAIRRLSFAREFRLQAERERELRRPLAELRWLLAAATCTRRPHHLAKHSLWSRSPRGVRDLMGRSGTR